MTKSTNYVTIKGQVYDLTSLDPEERKLVNAMRKEAAKKPSWHAFVTFWLNTVAKFYDARGVSRKQSCKSAVYLIGQDLDNRIALESGMARMTDYRGQIQEIIRSRFRTNRAFCEATGLSEDMLSHVLAGRKDLSMEALTQALNRIGYEIHIAARQKTAS